MAADESFRYSLSEWAVSANFILSTSRTFLLVSCEHWFIKQLKRWVNYSISDESLGFLGSSSSYYVIITPLE